MWKILLVTTAFNLLFEYSMTGINNLRVQPVLRPGPEVRRATCRCSSILLEVMSSSSSSVEECSGTYV